MALTRHDIADHIRNETDLSLKESVQATDTLLEIIRSTLESGDDVLLSGFGKFCVKEKAERKGRNPVTGKALVLPPRRIVTFKCSWKLRDRVNGGKPGFGGYHKGRNLVICWRYCGPYSGNL